MEVPVKVIKVRDASSFTVLEASPETDNALRFSQLEAEMREHFSNEQTPVSRPEFIMPNTICIGFCSSLMKWCRVKILHLMATTRILAASCYLLDYGTQDVLIPYTKLREASEKFLALPYRALQCHLQGIHPISYLTNPDDLHTTKQPCDDWSEAATIFVRRILEAEVNPMMTVLNVNPNDQLDVAIFTHKGGRLCSLAGQLVNAGHAVFVGTDGEAAVSQTAPSQRKPRLITRTGGLPENPPKPSLMSLIESKPKGAGRGLLMKQFLEKKAASPPGAKNKSSRRQHLSPSKKSEDSATSDTEKRKLKARLPRKAKTSPASKVISKSQIRALVSEGLQDPEIVAGLKAAGGNTSALSSDDNSFTLKANRKEAPVTQKCGGRVDFSDMPSLVRHVSLEEQVNSDQSNRKEDISFGYQADLDLTVSPVKQVPAEKDADSFDYCQTTPSQAPLLNESDFSVLTEEPGPQDYESPAKNKVASPHTKQLVDSEISTLFTPIPEEKFLTPIDSTDDDEGLSLRPKGVVEAPPLLQAFIGSTAKPKPTKADAVEISPDEEGVFLWSASKMRTPKPYRRVQDTPFTELIKRYFLTGDSLNPYKLQMYAWPAIVRGFDVVAVATSTPTQKAGKTLSHLLPILMEVTRSGFIDKLPRTNGPVVTILCSTWRKVSEVSSMCEKILGHSPLRVQKLFGGIREEECEISLINGCDIFVSTPCCLLRMLNKQILTFRRLRFFVLEEADVLVDQFAAELEEALNFRAEAVKMCVMSSTWTSSLRCFVAQYLPEALIIITTRLEAAIFGRVQQVPTVCPDCEKMTHVLGIVDPNVQVNGRSMIVCCDTAETVEVYKLLRSQSLYALYAHADLPVAQVQATNVEWNLTHARNSAPILVCSDEILDSMDVSNVEVIVHFSVAKNSSLFGARLWCARRKFLHPFLAEHPIKQGVVSHLLLSENDSSHASSLVRLLERCDVEIPRKLLAMRDRDLLQKEGSKQAQLCPHFKAFGRCSRQKWCRMRHCFYEALDGAQVPMETVRPPAEGEVKILVTHVRDATCFSARILTHTSASGRVTDLSAEYTKLTMSLGMHLSSSEQQATSDDLVPVIGELYGWKDPNLCFHRVKVLGLTTKKLDDRGIAAKARVLFVDSGGEQTVPSIELLHLPTPLTSVPHQVIEVIVCRVQPVDQDPEWTQKADWKVEQSVLHEEMHGVIVLSVGSTLWLDPLVIRENLPYLKRTTNKLNVTNLLLEEDMAVINPGHLHLLYAECEQKLKIPEALNPVFSPSKAFTTRGRLATLKTVEFEVDKDFFVEVHLTAIQDPDQVFLRFANQQAQLDEINAEASEYVQLNTQPNNFSPIANLLVIAKHPDVGSHCRGRIVEINSEAGEVDVFFVDYGEINSVALRDVHPLPDSLFNQTPTLAIECSLMDVEPIGAEWGDEAGDYLWGITQPDGLPISIYAQVKSRSLAKYAGRYGYGIVLWQTNRGYDIKLNEQLVSLGLATVSTRMVEEICYGCAPLNEEIPNVCTLAASMLQTRDFVEQARLACKINRIVRIGTESESYPDEMRLNGSLQCLCRCLPLCHNSDAVSALIEAIQHLCADNMQNIEEVLRTDSISTLCHMADDNHPSLAFIASACATFVKLESACADLLVTSGLRIFSQQMNAAASGEPLSPESTMIQVNCSLILLNLASSVKTRDDLKHVPTVFLENVSKEISSCESDVVVLNCLKALQPLALNHPTLRDSIRKTGGVKAVCANLLTWTNPQMIENGVHLLKSLANNNRFCKDIMVEMDAHKALKIIGKGLDISLEARKIALELNERLKSMLPSDIVARDQSAGSAVISVPGTQINNRPLPRQFLSSTVNIRSERPQVKWSQDKHNILLLVIVKGACDAKCDLDEVVTLTTNSMKFSLIFQSVKYECELGLYELISLSDCQKEVSGNEIRVGLRKVTKGLWPRLTKARGVSYVSVDFDRDFASSDESDSDNDNPKHPLALAKVKRQVQFASLNGTNEVLEVRVESSDTTSESGGSELEEEIIRDLL